MRFSTAEQLCSRTGLPARLCHVRFRVQSTNAVTRRRPAPRSDCILLHFTPAQPHWLELHSKLISTEDPLEAACKWKPSEALHYEPLTRIIPTFQIGGCRLLTVIKGDAITGRVKAFGGCDRSSISLQQRKTRKNDKQCHIKAWWAAIMRED